MSYHSNRNGRLGLLGYLAHRFMYVGLVVLAFGLMLLGKADTDLVNRVRSGVADAVAPVLGVLSRPASAVSDGMENVRELARLREENARLRKQNARLLHWQTAARRLQSQNRELRGLLDYVPMPDARAVAGRVIADTGGSFAQSVLVNTGLRDGVDKGQAVMTGEGLVGRIAQVGVRSARALLVTDLNSRIPVMVERTRARAVLAGDNSPRPRLLYLDPGSGRVEAGDRLVTSGDGGAFPSGLPVGVVVSVHENAMRVEPYVHRDELEYVRIVDYGLEGILKDPRPAPRAGVEEEAALGAAGDPPLDPPLRETMSP